jgi:peptide/nickel transport system substrate-binding protein
MPLFSPPDSLVTFNMELAKQYFNRSSVIKKNMDVDISYVSTSEEYRLTSFLLMDNLGKIGINLDLKPGLWSMNWDRARNLKTSPNIISMAWWPTLSSPSDWFFGLYKTEENPLFNLSYYSNTIVDSLLGVAWENESQNPERSKDIYKEIQNKLIDDCVVIPVVDVNVQSVHSINISGLKDNPAYSTIMVYHLGRKE